MSLDSVIGVNQEWRKQAGLKADDCLFPSRIHDSPHLGTRQYARILEDQTPVIASFLPLAMVAPPF